MHKAFGTTEAECRRLSWKRWNERTKAAADFLNAWGGPDL